MSILDTQYLIPPPIGKDFMASTTSSTLISSSQYVGICFSIPKSGTINKVGFLVSNGSLTGAVSVGLYTVGSTGIPTTTAYGGMSPGAVTNPASGTAYTPSLSTPATVTAGDFVCIKIIVTSLTGGDFRYRYHPSSYVDMTNGVPYIYNSRTASFSFGSPVFWLEYDDGSYVGMQNTRAEIGRTTLNFSSTTTPDEYGNKIYLPFPCNAVGLWCYFASANSPSGANGEYFRLYDEDKNVLAQTVIGQMHYLVAANGFYCLYFSSPVSLHANKKYFISLYEGTNTSARVWLNHSYPSNAAMDVSWDKRCTMVTAIDGGSFDESETEKSVPLGLIVNSFDHVSFGVGMNGGMKG